MTPAEQAAAIARIDANIGFIRTELEKGALKFKEVDEKIGSLELEVSNIKASSSGIWKGASGMANTATGLIGVIALIYVSFIK